jgi:methanethiol S-methyltransferase
MQTVFLVFAIALWGLVHSLLASMRVKSQVRRLLGPSVDRGYRLLYNIFAGLSFLPILALAAVTPDHRIYTIPFPWLLLTALGQFLAAAMLLVGFLQSRPMEFLGFRQLVGGADEGGNLNTAGLYHYVRHPLYTAGLVFLWLDPIVTVNTLVISISLTLYIVIGAYFEERKLVGEFGQAYRDYMALTPMFIPFLKGSKTSRKAS